MLTSLAANGVLYDYSILTGKPACGGERVNGRAGGGVLGSILTTDLGLYLRDC